LKVIIETRDPKTNKHGKITLDDIKPGEETKRIDQVGRVFKKAGFEIVDWTIENLGSITIKQAWKGKNCSNCGASATASFEKSEFTKDGILVSTVALAFCVKCYGRYKTDWKFRWQMHSLGLVRYTPMEVLT
jgi:hypothetical protein